LDHGKPQDSMQSAFAPAHFALDSANCDKPFKITAATMAGLCNKLGCTAKGKFDRAVICRVGY